MWQLVRRGAVASRKPVEEFITDRLSDAVLPERADLLAEKDNDLAQLANLDDQTLLAIIQSQLPAKQQTTYDTLLRKNSQGLLTAEEKVMMHQIGEEARHLTLKKAQAMMLLKWRGHNCSSFSP